MTLQKPHLKTVGLASVLLLGGLSLGACATEQYVDEHVAAVNTRVDAVDAKAQSTVAGFKKWQCQLCSFAYDEALGLPEEGIPAGTRWQDVPETWTCSDCSASKSDFQMVEV